MSRWTCGSSSRTRRGVNAAETELADAGLRRAVEGEERHHPVGVRTPGARIEGDAHPVGVRDVVAEGREHVRVSRQRPEVVAPRCGRAAPRHAVARTAGTDPRGSRSRRGRRATVRPPRWSSLSRPSSVASSGSMATTVLEAVAELVVGDQAHAGLEQGAGERQDERHVDELPGAAGLRAPRRTGSRTPHRSAAAAARRPGREPSSATLAPAAMCGLRSHRSLSALVTACTRSVALAAPDAGGVWSTIARWKSSASRWFFDEK